MAAVGAPRGCARSPQLGPLTPGDKTHNNNILLSVTIGMMVCRLPWSTIKCYFIAVLVLVSDGRPPVPRCTITTVQYQLNGVPLLPLIHLVCHLSLMSFCLVMLVSQHRTQTANIITRFELISLL